MEECHPIITVLLIFTVVAEYSDIISSFPPNVFLPETEVFQRVYQFTVDWIIMDIVVS